MNKLQLLRVVNVMLFISFLVQTATGIILFFGWNVFGAEVVDRVHNYNGLAMIALAIFHIVLNRGWITANFFRVKAQSVKK